MMSENLRPKSSLSRNIMIVILIAFAALAAARLNQLYCFSPDAADYVLMARGLVDHHEYRKFETPGEPYFTVRPPGLPVLLIPAALIAPYNVIFAKITIILTAIMMLALLYAFMCRLEDSTLTDIHSKKQRVYWLALFFLLLMATNPYILFFSTIVMSTIPFTLLTLAVLFLISKDEEPIKKRNLLLLTCLLSFLPLMRTIGVALILALGLWAVVKRKRWPYLICVFCALSTISLWMLRNRTFKMQGYSSLVVESIKNMGEVGVLGTLINMFNRTINNFQIISQKILPNSPGSMPVYENYILGNYHILPGPALVYSFACICIIAIAIYGMLNSWRRGGAVSLLYLGITFGFLSVWPWVHPRYMVPLLPVIIVFVPVGLIYIFRYFAEMSSIPKRIVSGVLITAGIALFVTQIITDYGLIYSNQQFISKGDDFYKREYPPVNFSNFVKAGEWINEHTPESARILPYTEELATTSHRYQRMTRFSGMQQKKLHSIIQSFSARYLVGYSRNHVSYFPWELMDNDLVYRLNPVYEKSGVIIFEVEPNYDGTIRHQYWHEDQSMEIATRAYEKFPNRSTTQMEYLNQLLVSEEYGTAIQFGKKMLEKWGDQVQIVYILGWLYLGDGQYQNAIQEFAKATRLPYQIYFRSTILIGLRRAQKKLDEQNRPSEKEKTAKQDLSSAKAFWDLANFKKSQFYINKVLNSDLATTEELGEAHLLMARLHFVNGRKEQAIEELNKANNLKNHSAKNILEMLNLENTISLELNHKSKKQNQKLEPGLRESILKLVDFYESEGVPGKSLKLLMKTHQIDPSDMQVLKLLAQYQLFYSMVPEAEENYLKLIKIMPNDKDIKQAMAKIEELKKVPSF